MVSLITLHCFPSSAQIIPKPRSDFERSHSSMETHNMQEFIKRIEGTCNNYYDKYIHRDSEGKGT